VARETEIAAVLDRRRGTYLTRPSAHAGANIPGGAGVDRRIKICPLQWRDCSINNALALAGNAGQRVLGGTAESPTRIGGQRTGQARDHYVRVGVGDRQRRAPSRLRDYRFRAKMIALFDPVL
jgi:hypothetical protein